MENKLKVGQTFEVVEVLTMGGYSGIFKVGGHTIDVSDKNILTNGLRPLNVINKRMGQHCAYMFDHEIKPIGKLTITKVK